MSTLAAFALLAGRRRAQARGESLTGDELREDTLVFLIRDGIVSDANFAGARFVERFPFAPSGLPRLRAALASRFDGIDALVSGGERADRHDLSRDGRLEVVSKAIAGAVRLRISPTEQDSGEGQDIYRLAATEAELETLRESTDKTPFLVWRETTDGTPVWVNRAYADRVSETFGRERLLDWPLPQLFPDLRPGAATRLSLSSKAEDKLTWFECHGTPLGPDTLYTAFDASATVQAETQLREFMQTLTKTFAQLEVGLAIFDKSRRLVLFNPSLNELTRLPVEFLTSKPSLIGFLDKLRERQMAPEPRDFKSWRHAIAELEAAAANGTYSETWTLPGNRTYRVSGRPHPDGAIAFLIEDISAEMALTRRFRADLETVQGVLDNLDQAIAVFSPLGVLSLSNRAYRELWSSDPEGLLAETGVVEATRMWHERSLPTPVWGDLRDFVLRSEDRAEWTAQVTLADGRNLNCRFVPLANGGTQSVFEIAPAGIQSAEDMLRIV